jgi:hypothetical protein
MRGAIPKRSKKNLKKLKKPLDKPLRVWYNKGTKEVKESNGKNTEAHESDVRLSPFSLVRLPRPQGV